MVARRSHDDGATRTNGAVEGRALRRCRRHADIIDGMRTRVTASATFQEALEHKAHDVRGALDCAGQIVDA